MRKLGIDIAKRKFDVALLIDGKFKTKVSVVQKESSISGGGQTSVHGAKAGLPEFMTGPARARLSEEDPSHPAYEQTNGCEIQNQRERCCRRKREAQSAMRRAERAPGNEGTAEGNGRQQKGDGQDH